MAKAVCIAIAEYGRINLIIQKNQKGYNKFAKVLSQIEIDGFQSWYGDVRDEDEKEQSGLIITFQIKKSKEEDEIVKHYNTYPNQQAIIDKLVKACEKAKETINTPYGYDVLLPIINTALEAAEKEK